MTRTTKSIKAHICAQTKRSYALRHVIERTTHEGFSLTWRVNVRTLMTSPKGLVIASSCSSGKFGGRPLTYTLGVRKVLSKGLCDESETAPLANCEEGFGEKVVEESAGDEPESEGV